MTLSKSELDKKLREHHLLFEEETVEYCKFDEVSKTWEVCVMENWSMMYLTISEDFKLIKEL